jgi:Cu(I)/Ag(I) efflux system protein CusF
MKLAAAAVSAALALALSPFAAAQTDHSMHQPGAVAPAAQKAPMTNGVVKRVDRKAGSVTIAHEPLVNLGMPAMTMSFLVKNPAWLDGMKEGARIRFVAGEVKGELTVVAFEPVK